MARNSKRNAFTIVELVIVIAVIAILSTVLITTFTGVIESANVSADRQLLSTMNTQIGMYIGKGNEINNANDLKEALSQGDIDYNEKLDPKSAQYGYHFWYDSAKQQIVLEKFETIETQAQAAVSHESIGRFLGAVSFAPRAAEGFEAASPRTLVPGFYFLDVVGKNKNELANFYADIENMSTDKNKYQGAISAIETLTNNNGDNKTLAAAVLAKMNATAIVTADGVFINAENTNQEIAHIYIPENLTGKEDYYLSHKVVNNANETLNDLTKFGDKVTISNITVPDDVKVGEGALTGFGDVTVNVNIDSVEELKNIFSAGSVSVDATIKLDNGASYKIEGAIVKEESGTTVNIKLEYRNPVTSFDVTATGNVVNKTSNNYIALDKIKNNISLTLKAINFVGADANLPVYDHVTWTADNGVTVNAYGEVTFPADFNADTVTFTATSDVVNGETAPVVKTYTVNVVRVKNATVNFTSGTNNGSVTMANGGEYIDANNILVTYDDASVTANFSELSAFKYADRRGAGNIVPFTDAEIETLGCTIPTAKMTTVGTYFTVSDSYAFTFTGVASLSGSIGTQEVTVKVSDKAGEVISATIVVTVNDNTDAPFKAAIPTYSNGHVYQVGNGNEIALGELFAQKAGVSSLSEYKIYVYNRGPSEGFFYTPIEGMTIRNPTETSKLNFAGLTGLHWVVLATDSGSAEEDETAAFIKVDVVPGKNVTSKGDLVIKNDTKTEAAKNSGSSTFNKTATMNVYDPNPEFANTSLVLHNNLDLNDVTAYSTLVTLNKGQTFYGNYFTLSLATFNNSDYTTGSADYSFMRLNNAELRDLIIDGPIYHTFAQSEDNDKTGFYCYGVLTTGDSKITNTYISGFLSTIRVENTTLEIKDSVLEGGSWSNIYINNTTGLTLDGTTTIQSRKSEYTSTKFGKTAKVIGIGVYAHHSLPNTSTLNITLKGDTKNINWIEKNDQKTYGGYLSMASSILFDNKQKDFFHTVETNTKYLNAAILWSRGVPENMNVVFDASYTGNKEYGKQTGGMKITWPVTIDLSGCVSSPKHNTSCGCASEVSATYGANKFVTENVTYGEYNPAIN